jgi:thioredoxin-like negative regulator of GroEL
VAAPPSPPTPPPPGPAPAIHTERKPVLVNSPLAVGAVGDVVDPGALEALLDEGRFDEALAAFKVLAKKTPADRAARAGIELCEGLRALAARDRLEAAQRFEAVLEIDPSNERAARELADMRRQATNERKGLLSRLMGKKE